MKPPAFQFYPKQYLGDDKVLLMDLDSQGAHMRLMCIAWQQDNPCTLPAEDDEQLRRWAGASEVEWPRIKSQVFNAWRLNGKRWIQDGLRRQHDKQQAYSESRSENRKRSDHMKNICSDESKSHLNHMEDEDVNEKSLSPIAFISADFAKNRDGEVPAKAVIQDWIARIGSPRLMGILADYPDKNAAYIEKCVQTSERKNARPDRTSPRTPSKPAATVVVKPDFGQKSGADVLRKVSEMRNNPDGGTNGPLH